MKIALCSAVWGRVPLTRIWWKGVDRIRAQFAQDDIETEVFVAGSEPEHRELCHQHTGYWVEFENDFLGAKWNAVVHQALLWKPHYIFILGSDDFFSPALVSQYARLAKRDVLHVGVRGVYIYDLESQGVLRLIADRRGQFPSKPGQAQVRRVARHRLAVGTGRLVHRALFQGKQYFWEPQKNQALDASLHKTLELPQAHVLEINSVHTALDVKSDTNIWSFDKLAELFPGCRRETTEDLHGIPEFEEIRSLTRRE